jgi:hypothetical protein
MSETGKAYLAGWNDGNTWARENPDTPHPNPDTWDECLINAVGFPEACEIVGIPPDADSPTRNRIFASYNRGAATAAKEYRENHSST